VLSTTINLEERKIARLPLQQRAIFATPTRKRLSSEEKVLQGFPKRVDEEFLSHVIFSDESLFTWEGVLNSRNMHVWNDENSRVTQFRNFQVRWKLNVWAEIIGTKVLSPVILLETLNGASYVQFLAKNLQDFLEEISVLLSK